MGGSTRFSGGDLSRHHHAIIIGSGIAGPAVALFLERIGIDSTIYEARGPGAELRGGMSLADGPCWWETRCTP